MPKSVGAVSSVARRLSRSDMRDDLLGRERGHFAYEILSSQGTQTRQASAAAKRRVENGERGTTCDERERVTPRAEP